MKNMCTWRQCSITSPSPAGSERRPRSPLPRAQNEAATPARAASSAPVSRSTTRTVRMAASAWAEAVARRGGAVVLAAPTRRRPWRALLVHARDRGPQRAEDHDAQRRKDEPHHWEEHLERRLLGLFLCALSSDGAHLVGLHHEHLHDANAELLGLHERGHEV